tara:strand:+ start:4937 stop:5542 length:606 start_codon:yes stop_codon:yes gene_type:complete
MIINTSSYTSAIPVALSDTINIPGPEVRISGATTSVVNVSGTLSDTNANFITTYNTDGSVNNQGVSIGMVVYNMYAIDTSAWLGPTCATIVTITDNNNLILSADIFPFAGGVAIQSYNVYFPNQANPKGAVIMVGDNQAGTNIDSDIYVKTINGEDILIQGVMPGTVLPCVVQRVMVGAAPNAGTGVPNTLTTAEKFTAFI